MRARKVRKARIRARLNREEGGGGFGSGVGFRRTIGESYEDTAPRLIVPYGHKRCEKKAKKHDKNVDKCARRWHT